MKALSLVIAAGLMVAGLSGAHADALDDIVKRGKVLIAIDISAPPFGIQNTKMEPDGADVDAAKLLAKDLGVELEIVPVTSANRIPYLQTKRVDLTMSSFSITPERAKAVAFSTPYGAINAVIFAPKSVDIKSAKDLAGKKIGVARGTTNETDLVAIAPPDAQIIRFDDEASTMAALGAGQIDAYSSSEIIASSMIPRYPDKHFESKLTLRRGYYGVAVRRSESELLQWVNTWVWFRKNSGDLDKIYRKWIGVALPELPTL